MELLAVAHPLAAPFAVAPPPAIVDRGGAPVKGRGDQVVAHVVAARIVAAALGDVDLARLGPVAVDVVLRHHPDGRPQPVALGHARRHLDAAVADRLLAFGVEPRRPHRVDDLALGRVADGRAGVSRVQVVHLRLRRGAFAVGAAIRRQVDCVAVDQLVVGDVGALERHGRHNVQALRIDVRIGLVLGGPVKGTGASSSSSALLLATRGMEYPR